MVGVRLKKMPEGRVKYVHVRLDVPAEYPISVPARTPIPPSSATGWFALQTMNMADGTHVITPDALFDQPYDLMPYLFTFSIDVDRPDSLSLPMQLRQCIILLDVGRRSEQAEPEVLIPSSPDGVYHDLP